MNKFTVVAVATFTALIKNAKARRRSFLVEKIALVPMPTVSALVVDTGPRPVVLFVLLSLEWTDITKYMHAITETTSLLHCSHEEEKK